MILKRAALHLPNGDWRRRDLIDVWLPPGLVVNEDRIKDVLASSLVAILARCKLTVYPMHRWTGADAAFDEVLLMEGVHGLASLTWPHWAKEAGKPPTKTPGSAQTVAVAVAVGDGAALEEVPEEQPPLPGTINGDAARVVAVQESEEAVPPAAVPDSSSNGFDAQAAAEENERHRREAGLWLASRPLARCIIVRQVMEPLRRLMSAQLTMGGADWAKRQRFAVVNRSTQAGGSHRRSHPIVEGALGTLENNFQKQVWLLMSEPALWDNIIPASDRNAEARGLSFRLLSSAGCWVEQSISMQHRRHPIRTFLMLASDEEADKLLRVPECLLDPWSAKFLAMHRDSPQGLRGEVPQATAELVAELADMNIGRIEATHASIRRRLYARSVQTHIEPLEEVSAEFVCDRMRKRGRQWSSLPVGNKRSRTSASARASSGHLPSLSLTAATSRGHFTCL